MPTTETPAPPQIISHGHHLFHGTLLVFLAEALLPLTGIVTASFLTRGLGAADYGLLTLSNTFISWIELAVNSLFSRAAVKIVSDAEDWRPVGAAILRLHVYVSLPATLICLMLAKPCAALMGEPKLAACFALFALEIPIYGLANCHRSLLIGRGKYAERSKIGAVRWIARLILVILVIKLGFSLTGAILAIIAASAVELAMARYYIRPSWSTREPVPIALWDYAIPLFLAALALRFMGLGLFMLKILGASAAETGIYGAAQNAAFVMPGVLAVSLSPLLLSTIARVVREDDMAAVKLLSRNAMRAALAMLPFVVMAAAASQEIAILFFGRHFAGSGPLMAILVFAGLAMIMINVQNAILIGCGNPSWIFKLTAPLLPAAIVGHLFAIPRFGSIGAASVTVVVTCLGALIGLIAIRKRLQLGLPPATLLRALLLSGAAFLLMHIWPVHGLAIIAQMTIVTLLIAAGFLALGELRKDEVRFFQLIVNRFIPRN